MKLLSHSNGIHAVEKEKISKKNILKNCAMFIIGLFILGFIVQLIGDFVDNNELKSRFKYVRIDGRKMEYKLRTGGTSGQGYTIVFDGAIGAGIYEWESICKTLEDNDISTFIYNRKGYGFNDGGDDRTPEEQAKDLKLLLKKAGAPEPYILVGEEYGSLVTTNFAKLYPNAVAGVVLIDPLSEDTIGTEEFKNKIKKQYYRSVIEKVGANFSLTALLNKLGLTMENVELKNSLTEDELKEFNTLENKKNYRGAISMELKNLYNNVSKSQEEGLLQNKPLYIITNEEDTSISKIGYESNTKISKVENNINPLSISEPDEIIKGINSILKDIKASSKKS